MESASFQVASPSPPDLHSGRTKIGETPGGAEGVGKSTDFAGFLSLTDTSYAVSLEGPADACKPCSIFMPQGEGCENQTSCAAASHTLDLPARP